MGIEIEPQGNGLSWITWLSGGWIVYVSGDQRTAELYAVPVAADGTVRGDPVRLPPIIPNATMATVFGAPTHFLSYHEGGGYSWDTGDPIIAKVSSEKGCYAVPSSWTSDGALLVAQACGADVTVHRHRRLAPGGERMEDAKGMWPVTHDDHVYEWVREGVSVSLRRTKRAAPIVTVPFPVLGGWHAMAEVGPKCNREGCVLRQEVDGGYRWVRLDATTGDLGEAVASSSSGGFSWSLHPTRPELSYLVERAIVVVDTKTKREANVPIELSSNESARALATLEHRWIVGVARGHRGRLLEVTRTSTKELRSDFWPIVAMRVSPDETNMAFVHEHKHYGSLFELTSGKTGGGAR